MERSRGRLRLGFQGWDLTFALVLASIYRGRNRSRFPFEAVQDEERSSCVRRGRVAGESDRFRFNTARGWLGCVFGLEMDLS